MYKPKVSKGPCSYRCRIEIPQKHYTFGIEQYLCSSGVQWWSLDNDWIQKYETLKFPKRFVPKTSKMSKY